MTKAERIFTKTYIKCRAHIKRFGYEENVGLNRMSYEENETFSKRTYNAVKRLLDKERKQVELSRRLGALSEDKICFIEQALNMLEVTLNNTYNMKEYIVYEVGNSERCSGKWFVKNLGTDKFTAEVLFSHMLIDWNNGHHLTTLVMEEE